MGLNPMTGVLKRDRRGETQTQRGHVEPEVELGGTQPHAQGCLESPETTGGRKGRGPALPGPQSPTWNSDICSTEPGEGESGYMNAPVYGDLLQLPPDTTAAPRCPCAPVDTQTFPAFHLSPCLIPQRISCSSHVCTQNKQDRKNCVGVEGTLGR